jgi:uncharacterized protein (DUF362 family)
MASHGSAVAFVKTDDRASGVRRALGILGIRWPKGQQVFLKPNLNSADPTPGSTHNDVLETLVQYLRAMEASRVTIGDRSGMGDPRLVMEQKGVLRMAQEMGFGAVAFDELPADAWTECQPEGSHWQHGFAIPRQVLEADRVVQTCCLKTHRFGGHFTMSLKNSVGLAAKRIPGDPHDYMHELHSSPHQRLMIAEVNAAYHPDLIVLDGVDALTEGGPDQGKKVHARVVLAGTDRVAVDAVGVALLRFHGTTLAVSQGPIFALEQIARAVELGLGVHSPAEIDLVTDDPDSKAYAGEIRRVLDAG